MVRTHEQISPRADQVALLISPPLTKDRAMRDLREPNWIQKFWMRPKEFAKLQFKRMSSWEQYEETIAIPVVSHLKDLRELAQRPSIIPDAAFRDFRSVLNNDDFQLVFLIAHHMMKFPPKNTAENDHDLKGAIEFADGGRDMQSVAACVQSACRRRQLCLVFVVCYSDELRADCYMLTPNVKAIGGFPSLAHFVTGVAFAKQWIMQCDGTTKLLEAYNRAMRVMFSISSTPQPS